VVTEVFWRSCQTTKSSPLPMIVFCLHQAPLGKTDTTKLLP